MGLIGSWSCRLIAFSSLPFAVRSCQNPEYSWDANRSRVFCSQSILSNSRLCPQIHPYAMKSRMHLNRTQCSLTFTLPALPTLISVALVSSSPCVPETLRNAPTAFLLATVLANLNAISAFSPAYAALTGLAPHAVALLLLSPLTFSSPQRSDISDTSSAPAHVLLIPFLIGAVATFVAALIPHYVMRSQLPHAQLSALVAAFAATYIGGSLNFIAVAQTLALPAHLSAAAVAVDLGAMAIYFAVLFALAARLPSSSHASSYSPSTLKENFNFSSIVTFPVPLAVVVAIVVISKYVVQILHLPSTASLIITSFAAATMSRLPFLRPFLVTAPISANFALNLFFASLGATSRLSAVVSTSPVVLLCAVIILLVHAILLYIVGRRILKIPPHHLLIASNANIGGATTAPAYAAACGWHIYVPAAIAAGTLGYLIGTPAALIIYRILTRSPN